MSIESLRSQIEAFRIRTMSMDGDGNDGRSDLGTPQDYLTLIDSLEKIVGSATEELNRAQLGIEAERQSYRNLFTLARDAYFMTDLQGIIRDVNPSGSSLLGIARNKLIGKALLSFVHPQERPTFSLQMMKLGGSKKFHKWETVLIRKPKGETDVSVSVALVDNYQGIGMGLRWLVQESTARAAFQERLRRSTGQLIESQRVGHTGIWEWDLQPDKVTWSDEMYRIFGLDPQSVTITYEDFLTFIHPEDGARIRTAIENSLKTHQPFSFDHHIIQPSGAIRQLHGQGIVLPALDNQPERLLGIAQDITERKQVEDQLRRLNVELQHIVDDRTRELSSANDLLTKIVAEREGKEKPIRQLNRELNERVSELQTVLSVIPVGITVAYDPQSTNLVINSAGKQIMRFLQDESLTTRTQSFKVLRHGQEIPVEDRPLRYAMTHNVFVRDAEMDIVYNDGTHQHLLAYASPLYDEQNQVRGGVSAFVDVTKHKAAEKRLAIQYAVAQALTESQNVQEGSFKVLQALGNETGWEFGVFWIFDEDAAKLYVENTWQKPGLALDELAEVSRNLWLSPKEGMPGRVYRSNKPLWLSGSSEQPDFLRKEAALKSRLDNAFLFPLRIGTGRVLGVIEFFSHQTQPPSAEMLEVFDRLGSQVGEFMGRAYEEDLRVTRMQQQAAITHLSQTALLKGDLQELLTEACTVTEQILAVEFCNVLELIVEKQQLFFRAGTGSWEETIIGQSHLDLEQDTQSAYIFSQTDPVNIVELLAETRFQPRPILSKHGIISGLSVVVPGRSPSFGLFEVYGRKRRIFTTDEIHFLQGVAHVVAAAVQHQEVENELRFSRNQMSVILSNIADGILAQDSHRKLVYANAAATHILGYADVADLMNASLEQSLARFQIFDEAGASIPPDQLSARLIRESESMSPLTIRLRALQTGEERWTMVKAQAVFDEEDQVVMVVDVFHDVTALKRAELGQRLLAETSRILTQDLHYETLLNNLATHLVPGFADWCAIDILDKNKILQRVTVAHVDPQRVTWAHEIHKRYPPDPNSNSGAYRVVGKNQSEYFPVITEEMINAIPDPEQRDLVHKIGLASVILVPLSARGNSLGVLSLIKSERHNPYTKDDLALAEDLGRRAGLALENARFYEDLELLNAKLEGDIIQRTIHLQKMRELYEISQSMSMVRTPEELLRVLLFSSYLSATVRASIAVFDKVGQLDESTPVYCTIISAWNKRPENLLYVGQRMTLADYGVGSIYSYTEPLIIMDIQHDLRVSDAMRERLLEIGVVSSIIFSLIAGGEWYGMLSIHFEEPIMLDDTDIRHVQGLVDEVAMGIYNFRLLETEAEARREAEEANRTKLKFLAMISHELRTPLTSIKGFSTTLLAEDVEWSPEDQRDFIETISFEADALSELIEQLLNLSRLEAGTLDIVPHPVAWKEILLTCLIHLQTLTIRHRLIVEEPAADLPLLNADIVRISQVLTNLISNAVKYSPEHTTITISAEQLSSKFVKISVMDEGVGIPPEERNRVFEAFQQLENNSYAPGAGLGLAICRGLVEAHGGRIWVEDRSHGPGTTMSFTLPIAAPQR